MKSLRLMPARLIAHFAKPRLPGFFPPLSDMTPSHFGGLDCAAALLTPVVLAATTPFPAFSEPKPWPRQSQTINRNPPLLRSTYGSHILCATRFVLSGSTL